MYVQCKRFAILTFYDGSPQSIIGRSMVICTRADDLGKGGHELSLIDGNAGPAVAVAVVGITD